MKRFVAQRKSTKRCIYCDKPIEKGQIYYRERKFYKEWYDGKDEITTINYYRCVRCNYEQKRKRERYERFVESGTCKHPKVETVWGLIAGEDYAQEPKYDECQICRKKV